ncbi:MAG: sigma factor, partial [Verrucomicrobiota bacterium]
MNSISVEELIEQHYEGLFRFALSLSRDRDLSSDLVQQTFFLMVSKARLLRQPRRAKSYLFTTLYREFLKHQRKESRVLPIEEVIDPTVSGSVASSDILPFEACDGNAALAALHSPWFWVLLTLSLGAGV